MWGDVGGSGAVWSLVRQYIEICKWLSHPITHPPSQTLLKEKVRFRFPPFWPTESQRGDLPLVSK